MEKELNSIEDLFRQASENRVEIPSRSVLRRIRFRLWMDDFFSVHPKKFNIVYATLVVAGVSVLFLLNDRETGDLTYTHEEIIKEEIIEPVDPEPALELNDRPNQSDEPESKVFHAPVAEFEADAVEGCSPLKVHFTNKSKNAAEYHWDFGNGTTSGLAEPMVVYSNPGNYKVSLKIRNENGSEAIEYTRVVVKEKPKAALAIDIEASEIGKREIHFKNFSKQATNYVWDFGDHSSNSGKEIKHTYKKFGIYRVKLIAFAENGCSDTAELTNRFIEKNYELSFPLSFRPDPMHYSIEGYYESAGDEASVFYPRNLGARSYHLEILAPNGITVFSTDNIRQGWNGYIRGRIAPGGTYSYKSHGVYPNGKKFKFEGRVEVLTAEYYSD
jgi:PKD repeat protein